MGLPEPQQTNRRLLCSSLSLYPPPAQPAISQHLLLLRLLLVVDRRPLRRAHPSLLLPCRRPSTRQSTPAVEKFTSRAREKQHQQQHTVPPARPHERNTRPRSTRRLARALTFPCTCSSNHHSTTQHSTAGTSRPARIGRAAALFAAYTSAHILTSGLERADCELVTARWPSWKSTATRLSQAAPRSLPHPRPRAESRLVDPELPDSLQQSGPPQQYQQQRYASEPAPNIPTSSPVSRRNGRNSTDAAAYGAPASPSRMTPSRAHHDEMNPSTYERFYPDSAGSRGQHNALPIRTSTQQAPQSPPAASYEQRPYTARATYDGTGYSSQDDRDRRRSHRSPHDSPAQQGGNRSQRTRQVPGQSRSQTAVGQPPVNTELPRENSTVINRIVVDDPSSDVARENARIAEARPHTMGTEVAPVGGLGLVGESGVPDSGRSSNTQRSRQEHLKGSSHRKEVKFGDYILGQTLGEGEFGKVKMGWKKEGGVQVAIKLIRKESLAGNATRLPKIYREISILKELQHPNIVRLHEFVETERHMGIILEYASGGELFDYILNHRYLKDPAARRLFAQLVSGVGYLHRKGIVHRDLKLENLLLDRHKNIIITDFGFANTFNPRDDLNEEQEHRISDKEYVKREGLDLQNKEGYRRGDLMQTSCGSPCYAAPELVVSDGLYTGRKVDVWSCGVILYAMLAGYLPFDDDPANPEGDNINLLYKYIVSTPLTFPEYVTPHARDLLRRILVPDPRRRADLFEVARHSWLSEYSHVVGFIGSNNKDEQDIASSAVSQDMEQPALGRSASVREPQSRTPSASAATAKQPTMDAIEERKAQRDAKRRTVQLEYVPPGAAHPRGETSPIPPQQANVPIAGTGRTRARPEAQGPVEVVPSAQRPQVPRKEVGSQAMPPPSRAGRDSNRAVSEATVLGQQPTTTPRPNTRGTLASRGNSYSQPAVATPTAENAQGHFSRPKSGSGYIISGSMQQPPNSAPGESINGSQQSVSQAQPTQQLPQPHQRGHKRSSTLGSLTDRVLGRSNSRRQSQQAAQDGGASSEKKDRRHPPVSMKNAVGNYDESGRRPSTDSRRSSFQFLRKNSEQQGDSRRNSRRFSFLPSNFSMNSFSGKQNQPYDSANESGRRESRGGRPSSRGMAFGRGASRSPNRSTNSINPQYYDAERDAQRGPSRRSNATQEKALPYPPQLSQKTPPPMQQRKQYRDDGYGGGAQEPVERYFTPNQDDGPPSTASDVQPHFPVSRSPYPPSSVGQATHFRDDGYGGGSSIGGQDSEVHSSSIRPNQRRFGDAYEKGHEGSSSGARRVMDFFRRRGRERGGD
ncbi:hypothetical protein Q7P37_003999 [Cladosporium fusiforme]